MKFIDVKRRLLVDILTFLVSVLQAAKYRLSDQ
jgi:hypothetical protein